MKTPCLAWPFPMASVCTTIDTTSLTKFVTQLISKTDISSSDLTQSEIIAMNSLSDIVLILSVIYAFSGRFSDLQM